MLTVSIPTASPSNNFKSNTGTMVEGHKPTIGDIDDSSMRSMLCDGREEANNVYFCRVKPVSSLTSPRPYVHILVIFFDKMILPGTIEGMKDEKKLINLNKLIRRDIIEMTTAAQSGHPTSALSAVELMSSLMMGGFFDHSTDKLIFSKGHGSPLLYSLYHHLGHVTHEELLKFRQFDSLLEGHPVPNLPFIEVATGSLGQGISLAIGMAMAKKIHSEEGQIFVLCGDAETAEGQIWHFRLFTLQTRSTSRSSST
jgi:hypothetical protein